MPVVRNGRLRKRWRYLAYFGPEVMLCAARVQIGPVPQSFWAVWDRGERRRFAHTRMLPGGNEVEIEGDDLRLDGGDVSAELSFGAGEAIESVCPSPVGEGAEGYAWTRKRAGVEVSGRIEAGGRSWRIAGLGGVDDESAGYHQRHTDWYWSAGVGEDTGGRAVAWNLVTGINDPPRGSERAIWVDGLPSEPDPVSFDGLQGVDFADGSRLRFGFESERARDDNLLLLRSRYRHRFGTFSGGMPGIELREGFGVMEEHSAVW
jgi:Domain of unknown function (DUF2804), C-terminal